MSQTNDSCISFAQLVGVEIPFLNAPMAGIATPELVAAVSNAGGLGVIPAAELTPEEIREFAAAVREKTDRPFALNLAVPVEPGPDDVDRFRGFADAVSMLFAEYGLPDRSAEEMDATACFREIQSRFQAQFAAALEVKPAAVISSFGGFREPEEEALAEHGIVNIGTATTLREAKVLRAARCQAIIVQGSEAAGPRLSFEDEEDALVGLMSLVPAAVRATGLPVLAAGGIATPEQVGALAALGAVGIVAGTALIPTAESGAPEFHRWYARSGTATDTTLTRVYNGRLSRVLKNSLVPALADYESKTAGYPLHVDLMTPFVRRVVEAGEWSLAPLPLGQSAGRSAYRNVADCVKALALG